MCEDSADVVTTVATNFCLSVSDLSQVSDVPAGRPRIRQTRVNFTIRLLEQQRMLLDIIIVFKNIKSQ